MAVDMTCIETCFLQTEIFSEKKYLSYRVLYSRFNDSKRIISIKIFTLFILGHMFYGWAIK